MKIPSSAGADSTTETAVGRRLNSPAGLVRLVLWAGASTGAVQLAGLAIRKWGLGEFLYASSDAWWTTPVTTMAVFTALAVTMSVVARWSHPDAWSQPVGGFVFLATLSFLYLFPAVHRLAALILAVGMGFQGFRMVARRPVAFELLTRPRFPLSMRIKSPDEVLRLSVQNAVHYSSATFETVTLEPHHDHPQHGLALVFLSLAPVFPPLGD